eukprot:2143633-Pyramimonas_sp.AAC.1
MSRATVLVVVHPRNDPPYGVAADEVVVPRDAMVPVTLMAADGDDADSIRFFLTTLPQVGAVYATADGVNPAWKVNASGTPLPYVSQETRSVMVLVSVADVDTYVDGDGDREQPRENFFGFCVQDAAGPELSAEVRVRVTLHQPER